MWNVPTFLHFLSHYNSSIPTVSHLDHLQDLLTHIPASARSQPLHSKKHWVTNYAQSNLCYLMFCIRTLTFSLSLVFFRPLEIILGLGYHIALMEERVPQKQQTIFGCFLRLIPVTSMGTLGSHSYVSGKGTKGSAIIAVAHGELVNVVLYREPLQVAWGM